MAEAGTPLTDASPSTALARNLCAPDEARATPLVAGFFGATNVRGSARSMVRPRTVPCA